jgi:enamine deaminase RidA (YjgF/YER057c/UK114 family)
MTLKIERFQPEGMNVRMSGGQPSYSHVVTVSGTGKIVYTAGQLARDIDGNCVGKGDMRAQMEQTFKNLDRCLKACPDFMIEIEAVAVINSQTRNPGRRESRYSSPCPC